MIDLRLKLFKTLLNHYNNNTTVEFCYFESKYADLEITESLPQSTPNRLCGVSSASSALIWPPPSSPVGIGLRIAPSDPASG